MESLGEVLYEDAGLEAGPASVDHCEGQDHGQQVLRAEFAGIAQQLAQIARLKKQQSPEVAQVLERDILLPARQRAKMPIKSPEAAPQDPHEPASPVQNVHHLSQVGRQGLLWQFLSEQGLEETVILLVVGWAAEAVLVYEGVEVGVGLAEARGTGFEHCGPDEVGLEAGLGQLH